ncbi:MAG: hypothetical protein ACREQQ_02330 [Candidatus Binatia bacterium]
MPRMQVYLPTDLYREVKRRRLSPSGLLQAAVRREVARKSLEAEADRYFAELEAEVPGEPSAEETRRAEALADRIDAHLVRGRRAKPPKRKAVG